MGEVVATFPRLNKGDRVVFVKGARAGKTGVVTNNRAKPPCYGSILVSPDDRSCIAHFARPAELRLVNADTAPAEYAAPPDDCA